MIILGPLSIVLKRILVSTTHINYSFIDYEVSLLITYKSDTKSDIVSIQTNQFSGSPVFEDGDEFLPNDSESLKYISDPSPEVDQAWDELTHCMHCFTSLRNNLANLYGQLVISISRRKRPQIPGVKTTKGFGILRERVMLRG